MNFFDVVLAASGAVHDTVYGEPFLIEPRAKTDPNGRASADANRPAKTITGVWADPQAEVQPTNRTGHPAGEGARFDSSNPKFDFEVSALPYALVIGDLVTRVRTNTRYAVSDPGDDGFSRATVKLTANRGRS